MGTPQPSLRPGTLHMSGLHSPTRCQMAHGLDAALMYVGSLSVWVRCFTADLSKLLIHHHYHRGEPLLTWVSHKYQQPAVQTWSSITQPSLIASSVTSGRLKLKVFRLTVAFKQEILPFFGWRSWRAFFLYLLLHFSGVSKHQKENVK